MELPQAIFTCLSFLFKYLARPLVAELDSTFRLYLPLLAADRKPYVRQFAAESFAFLLRRVKTEQMPAAMRLLMGHAADLSGSDGLSLLLFESVKVTGRRGGWRLTRCCLRASAAASTRAWRPSCAAPSTRSPRYWPPTRSP